jgi:raffinose/stachyose/melibiose transport system substrate-binding protein
MKRTRSRKRFGVARAIATLAVSGLLTSGVGASAGAARTDTRSDTVSISMLTTVNSKPGWDVLIRNFELAYPDLRLDITYVATNTALYQLETTELAAGNAPDILATTPGCGTPIAICALAKAGYLAGMPNKPWAKRTRSVPLVLSYGKYGQRLFGSVPQVAPFGIFTNDSMFKRLRLKIPQTFTQLLDVCRKAKAAGTAAVILAGGSATPVTFLIEALAVPNVYGTDKRWTGKLKAGKVTFAGSRGWRQALQHFIDMNNAGCFQPGALGVSSGTLAAQLFAQGQGLMFPLTSNNDGTISAASPQFSYSFHAFPGGTSATQTTTFISLLQALSVNAHSSAKNQAAAQTFVDFVARPQQNALFTKLTGGLSQYQLLKGQIPTFMSTLATVFAKQTYVINPYVSWWNASALLAMQQNQIGLITGQRSIDDVLKAMDAAWQLGPS